MLETTAVPSIFLCKECRRIQHLLVQNGAALSIESQSQCKPPPGFRNVSVFLVVATYNWCPFVCSNTAISRPSVQANEALWGESTVQQPARSSPCVCMICPLTAEDLLPELENLPLCKSAIMDTPWKVEPSILLRLCKHELWTICKSAEAPSRAHVIHCSTARCPFDVDDSAMPRVKANTRNRNMFHPNHWESPTWWADSDSNREDWSVWRVEVE